MFVDSATLEQAINFYLEKKRLEPYILPNKRKTKASKGYNLSKGYSFSNSLNCK